MKLIKRKIIKKPKKVYNLHIDKNNNYTANGVVVSNCHGCKAAILESVLEHAINAKYRFGFTGTMPPSRLDELTVKSFIGPVIKEYGSKWLHEHGYIAGCDVNMVTINYKQKIKGDYNTIKDICFNNPYRVGLIKHILNETNSSVLILVDKVEKEGAVLKEILLKSRELKDRTIEFISGKDDAEIREQWRKKTNESKNIILIATYAIFQVGVNIKSLDTLIMGSPSKSKIRVLQSIGRTLRKDDGKVGSKIWDICDQVKYLKDHADIRFRHYNFEGFKIYEVSLSEGDNYNIELKEAD
jgi:superfamily II DNA or RNA helicase